MFDEVLRKKDYSFSKKKFSPSGLFLKDSAFVSSKKITRCAELSASRSRHRKNVLLKNFLILSRYWFPLATLFVSSLVTLLVTNIDKNLREGRARNWFHSNKSTYIPSVFLIEGFPLCVKLSCFEIVFCVSLPTHVCNFLSITFLE